MKRKNISSGTKWENSFGYSRAVKIGNLVEIAGTVAVEKDEIVGKGDPYLQTRCILEKIKVALQEAGASLKDVVRTRMFVTDISKWPAVGKAHGEFFKDIKPVTTLVEVKALVAPEFLVEIEARAVIGEE